MGPHRDVRQIIFIKSDVCCSEVCLKRDSIRPNKDLWPLLLSLYPYLGTRPRALRMLKGFDLCGEGIAFRKREAIWLIGKPFLLDFDIFDQVISQHWLSYVAS